MGSLDLQPRETKTPSAHVQRKLRQGLLWFSKQISLEVPATGHENTSAHVQRKLRKGAVRKAGDTPDLWQAYLTKALA